MSLAPSAPSRQATGDRPGAGRTALVTGGGGFIGGRLIARLVADGWSVRALVRSDEARSRVAALGAHPSPGHLHDEAALTQAATGCDVAFHLAALIGDHGVLADYLYANVMGTAAVVQAARRAGVRRLINVSTFLVVHARESVTAADEETPVRLDSPVPYNVSKVLAELMVSASNGSDLETITIRPAWTWGAGDRHLLPEIIKLVRQRRFAWLDGGEYRIASSHVDNVVHALVLAVDNGTPSASYFVTDDADMPWRDFIGSLLTASGLPSPTVSVPLRPVLVAARLVEACWRRLWPGRRPPLTVAGCLATGLRLSVDDSRARAELGYRPVRTVEEGLEELRAWTEGRSAPSARPASGSLR